MTRLLMLKLTLAAAFIALPAFAQSSGGITWAAPKTWTAQGEKPMRAATYSVPASAGDAEGGECAVFYFGAGQGGGVDDNVKRWAGQFEGGKAATTKKEKVNGLDVTRVELEGTYLSGGGMSGPKTPKPGFKLLGAIIEGKQGPVFFKLTAPAKTLEGARKDFDALVKSLKAT